MLIGLNINNTCERRVTSIRPNINNTYEKRSTSMLLIYYLFQDNKSLVQCSIGSNYLSNILQMRISCILHMRLHIRGDCAIYTILNVVVVYHTLFELHGNCTAWD